MVGIQTRASGWKVQTNPLSYGGAPKNGKCLKTVFSWAVVVAQLAEWSLPITEDPGSNPVIGNLY